jgi:hypothetical protein
VDLLELPLEVGGGLVAALADDLGDGQVGFGE